MALKKLTFELARASRWNYFIPFLAKGARNKTYAFVSNIDILTIYGPILTIPFSVGPYSYYKYLKFDWGSFHHFFLSLPSPHCSNLAVNELPRPFFLDLIIGRPSIFAVRRHIASRNPTANPP